MFVYLLVLLFWGILIEEKFISGLHLAKAFLSIGPNLNSLKKIKK